ncbi:universal stress family protein [Candidatus Nitrosopumilus salaria BD31]|uniref:Universal stress family protein n=1 Tax=Candidatus Nitrosopumilus salarius BD31 TaxID=859350 RepID=I3D1I7_9ARCH|nr:universal stress protein [Candidatus Nitrosopumilus salaria]EIJ65580.1 universal stress family protein [Candidatus Nitrosopumilus salaria BD31]
MAFNNILVPYDDSISSLRAFNKAIELAKQHNSHIKVVSCLDIGNLGGWYIDKRINKDIMRKAKKITEDLFSKLEGIAKKNMVSIEFKIIESNNTVKSIITFTKSKHIDLVIMGSSGRGNFDKTLLGSVSNGVMQKAKCPVLIIKN